MPFHKRVVPYSRAAGVCAVVLCLARGSAAQPADSISIREAIRLARSNNPDLAAAREGLEAARAQSRIAREIPNPNLTATTNKIPTDGTAASTVAGNGLFDRSYDSTAGIAQLVELPGKRRNRLRSASEALRQAQARLEDADRTVFVAVLRGYSAVAVARETAEIDRRSAESFRKTAALAVLREEAGEISASDRAQIEIAAGRSDADALAAGNAFRNAVRSMESLLGLDPSRGRAFPDSVDALLAAIPAFDPEDEETTLADRADLVALEAAVRRAEADLALQRAIRLPDPTVLVQYERQPPDQRNTVGAGFSISLPVFHSNGGAIAAAEVALAGARRELAEARRRVRIELASTRDALDAAKARENRYRSELVPRVERVRSTVEFAYSQGGASLLELLEAERSANEVRLAAVSAAGDLATASAEFAGARVRLSVEGGRS